MPRFKVHVAERNTGVERVIVVKAGSTLAAKQVANYQGWLVSSIEPVTGRRFPTLLLGAVIGAGIVITAICAVGILGYVSYVSYGAKPNSTRTPASPAPAQPSPVAAKVFNEVRNISTATLKLYIPLAAGDFAELTLTATSSGPGLMRRHHAPGDGTASVRLGARDAQGRDAIVYFLGDLSRYQTFGNTFDIGKLRALADSKVIRVEVEGLRGEYELTQEDAAAFRRFCAYFAERKDP